MLPRTWLQPHLPTTTFTAEFTIGRNMSELSSVLVYNLFRNLYRIYLSPILLTMARAF